MNASHPLARANWALVNPALRDELVHYIDFGIVPGPFLTAVISNNLRNAIAYADEYNRFALAGLVRFLVDHAPRSAWGTPEAVAHWEDRGGDRGRPVEMEFAS